MRLKVSGDKHEIRQSYIPALFPHLVKPLIDEGAVSPLPTLYTCTVIVDLHLEWLSQKAVDDIIDRMDEYYLSREDWDTIVELGVDDRKDDLILKKISAATKSALTKKWVIYSTYEGSVLIGDGRYNTRDHPIVYHRQDLGKVPKKLAGGPAPDLEEAFDVRYCVFMCPNCLQ